MKALLFCQTGDGRPKCYGKVPGPGACSSPDVWQQMARPGGGWDDFSLFTDRQDDALRAADRWWLVSCENAEAGRRYIRDQYMDDYPGYRAECAGRILASGGKP